MQMVSVERYQPFIYLCCILLFIDCNDGDVMLYGGSNSFEGTVEICYDNLWGLVSHSGWTTEDAEVICKQLGLETNS